MLRRPLEQTEKDIESSANEVEEARASVATYVKELKALAKEQAKQQVCLEPFMLSRVAMVSFDIPAGSNRLCTIKWKSS